MPFCRHSALSWGWLCKVFGYGLQRLAFVKRITCLVGVHIAPSIDPPLSKGLEA